MSNVGAAAAAPVAALHLDYAQVINLRLFAQLLLLFLVQIQVGGSGVQIQLQLFGWS